MAIEGSDKPRRQYELSIVGEPRCLGLEDCLRRKAKRKRRKRRETSTRAEDKLKEYEGAGERREGPGKK